MLWGQGAAGPPPPPQPTPHTSTPLAESEIELILGCTHPGEVIDPAALEVQDPDLRTSCTRGADPARLRRHVGVVSVASHRWGGDRAGPQTGMQETRGEALTGAGPGATAAGGERRAGPRRAGPRQGREPSPGTLRPHGPPPGPRRWQRARGLRRALGWKHFHVF